MDKKVLLAFTSLSSLELQDSNLPNIVKARDKGTHAPLSFVQDAKSEAGAGIAPVPEKAQAIWEAAKENGFQVGSMQDNVDFSVVQADSLELLDRELENIYAIGSKKSLVVIVAKDAVYFQGLGIERGVILDRPVEAASVAPTISYIADLPLPASVAAPVAYAVLKGLNFKMKEVQKLSDSVDALNKALDRTDKNSSWRKHDCA